MKDNVQFALILGLFAYLIFLQQCKQASSLSNQQEFKADTTIVIDTILPAPVIVQMTRQVVPEPIVIYVDGSSLGDRNKIQGDSIQSQALADILADMKSSAGGNAIKEIQGTLNDFRERLSVDGAFGLSSL
jgi:hypothetical protein